MEPDGHAQTNFFTNTTDIASQIGLNGLPANPLLYGLPSLSFTPFTGFNEQQPNIETQQTISLSDSISYIHGKHNMRYGGDVRRVHLDLLGNTGTATGSYTFTGVMTEEPGSNGNGTATGSAFADFLLGLPQQTSLQAPYQKSYLRENVWDAYAQDDWRVLSEPDAALWLALRILFALLGKVRPPFNLGHGKQLRFCRHGCGEWHGSLHRQVSAHSGLSGT